MGKTFKERPEFKKKKKPSRGKKSPFWGEKKKKDFQEDWKE
jgi:hypothetical protein